VAVSGGLDSMVLLALMHRAAATHGWRLTVAHFNHRLRGAESDADEQLVRRTARQLKAPFVAGSGDVTKFAARRGLSLEMAARKMRHDFLAKTAARLKIPMVALAHHADDQVELFFLRILRGSGMDGLAGMKSSNPSPSAAHIQLIRPLLDQTKAALQAYARDHHIVFSEDASNASLDIQRNRIRHELIPLLTQHYQPALSATILRVMDVAGAEAQLVANVVQALSSTEFDRLPLAAQRRLVHQQLLKLKLSPDFDLIERLRRSPNEPFAVNAESRVWRDSAGVVHVGPLPSREPRHFRAQKKALSLRRRAGVANFGGLEISWRMTSEAAAPQAGTEYFDAEKVGKKIWLRRWQPGDRFQPIGASSPRKLQDLFTNLRVPRAQRHERILATTSHGEIFWVEGLRMTEKFKLDEQTTRRLQWQWRRNKRPQVVVADSTA